MYTLYILFFPCFGHESRYVVPAVLELSIQLPRLIGALVKPSSYSETLRSTCAKLRGHPTCPAVGGRVGWASGGRLKRVTLP